MPKGSPYTFRYKIQHHDCELRLEYSLIATCGEHKSVKPVTIVSTQIKNPMASLQEKVIEARAGGFFGFGGELARTKISLTQNQFRSGDKITVKFNSNSTSISSFKLKLEQTVVAIGERCMSNGSTEKVRFKHSKYIDKVKQPFRQNSEELTIKVPSEDQLASEHNRELCESLNGQLIKVTYDLKAFVKHVSWRGEGHLETFPIRILRSQKTKVGLKPLTGDSQVVRNYVWDKYYEKFILDWEK